MQEYLIVNLPRPHRSIRGCWAKGYTLHKGITENSLNMATLVSTKNRIIPNQGKLKNEYDYFVQTLKEIGCKIHFLPFPEECNREDNPNHDAIFIRDAGMNFKNYWIKARFSCKERAEEADIYAKMIKKRFKKEILEQPEGAYLEAGEVIYVEAKNGSYYFGGLSRSNKKGHDFVREIVHPDQYILLESEGYHLDTALCPVKSSDNILCGLIVAAHLLSRESLKKLKELDIELLPVNPMDSTGIDENLGSYAVNALTAPGIMINGAEFITEGLEERLKAMQIKRFITPLTFFRFAGGSAHCLTNEIST